MTTPFTRLCKLSAITLAAALAACANGPETTETPSSPSTPVAAVKPAPAPVAASVPASAPASAPAAKPANDYAKPESWLCRPGRQDACTAPLSLTTIAADGSRSVGAAQTANADAAFDCFYVYPTVSNDTTPNSDMTPGPEEANVVFAQFSPFRTQCRLYAPLYRQVTVPALRAQLAKGTSGADWRLPYADVLAAWKHYLAHDNQGRGVVLIGHSQGALVLTELVAREIEGTPVQRRLISVSTIGSNLLVPKGQDVGGSFKSTPLCRSATQTGCAISYVSFRDTNPPPAKSLFGRSTKAESVVACNNPAALKGGPAPARAWYSRPTASSNSSGGASWKALGESVQTPFFAAPGLITTRCVQDDNGSYLAVQVNGDQRAQDIGGDVVVGPFTVRDWGLHLIDMNLGMGDLLDIVRQQGQAYAAQAK